MEVVDVRHVDGVLEDSPVTALKLDLAIHRPPPGHEHSQRVRHLIILAWMQLTTLAHIGVSPSRLLQW